MILPLRRQFEDRALVRIVRRLPGPGKTLVQVGDKLAAEEAVGTAEVSGGSKRINLAQVLGVGPGKAESALLKSPGEVIYHGEPLARLRRTLGFRNKVYLSPVDGILDIISDGEVTIRFAPSEVTVPAEFAGVVAEVTEGESVTMKLSATRLIGLVGVGEQRFGEIKIVGPGVEPLAPQDIDGSLTGKIVVGGSLLPAETVVKGLAIGVRAFFCGGVNFHDTLGWGKGGAGLTIVSWGGYGESPIREELWKKLRSLDGQRTAISGEEKSLIIPGRGPGRDAEAYGWRELRAGDTVRVTSGEEVGLVGTAAGVTNEPVELPSGLSVEVVKIKARGRDLVYPWTNLEIIETK